MKAEGTARAPVRGVAGKVLSEVPAVEEKPPFILMPVRFLEAQYTPFHDFGVNGVGLDPKGFGRGVNEPRGVPAGDGYSARWWTASTLPFSEGGELRGVVILEQHAPRSVARADTPWLEGVPDFTV